MVPSLPHQRVDFLDAKDLELFSHYMLHTSRAVNFDEEDFFALQVGIPNLAVGCKPLMSSILAVAATCSCYDIISRPTSLPGDRQRIIELLTLANRNHMRSLQEIQSTISNTKHYDQILANALLMATYGASSQRVKIWLANTKPAGEVLADEFMPSHSGWISLFHAVHMAYISLLNGKTQPVQFDRKGSGPASLSRNPMPFNGRHVAHQDEVIPPIKQPTNSSKHVLYPILAATSIPALNKIQECAWALAVGRVDNQADTATMPSGELQGRDTSNRAQILACCAAMEILSSIAAEIFSAHGSGLGESCASYSSAFQFDFRPLGLLSEVSDWLRAYLARALAVAPSRPLRRVVMAFLYRVPEEYLSMVQGVLDSIPVKTEGVDDITPEGADYQFSKIGAADQLAVDILAHWLVFVMLLDGVWWIGDIGFWELGRIVSFVQKQCLPMTSCRESGGDWWPASMYRVGIEFRKHMNRSS
jgi:hypothetical protein